MALSEIWKLVATPNDVRPLWAERRTNSPLVSVGPPDADGNSPLSTVTLRTRYREDITTTVTIESPDGRRWVVSELLEVGRRKYLDLALSTYAPGTVVTPTIPDPTPTDPEQPADFVPPDGWGIVADGAPVSVLTIASAEPAVIQPIYRWDGTFDDITGASGMITTADLEPDPAVHATMAGYVLRTGSVCRWLPFNSSGNPDWRGFLSLTVTDQTTALMDGYNMAFAVSRTAHPMFVGDEIRIFTRDEWRAWFLNA